jgi:hypothetical protein
VRGEGYGRYEVLGFSPWESRFGVYPIRYGVERFKIRV